MPNLKKLSSTQAKRCHTVNAWTLFEGKTFLVLHKKLGIWLAPGGHVEENELPHQAAEREFFEESGMHGEVVSFGGLQEKMRGSEYLPIPFYCNLHEINKPRGDAFCQQHYSWGYFIRVESKKREDTHDDGVLDMGWFTLKEMEALQTHSDIRSEAEFVFSYFPDIQ